MVVAAGALSLSPVDGNSFPTGFEGADYGLQNVGIVASGGITAMGYNYASQGLPSGLSVDKLSGKIIGTATESGIFNFSVSATNDCSTAGSSTVCNYISTSNNYVISINAASGVMSPAATPPAPDIPYPLTTATINQPYQALINVTHPDAINFTFSFSGDMPPGLVFDTDNGQINGVATKSGNYIFAVTATLYFDNQDLGYVMQSYQLTVNQGDPFADGAGDIIKSENIIARRLIVTQNDIIIKHLRSRHEENKDSAVNKPAKTAIWLEGNVAAGNSDDSISYNDNGLVAGLDFRSNPQWLIGIAVSHAQDHTQISPANSHIKAINNMVNLYLSYQPQADIFIDGIIGSGLINDEAGRQLNDMTLTSRRSGNQWFASLTIAKEYKEANWQTSLYGRLDYDYIHLKPSTEGGDDQVMGSLHYNEQNTNAIMASGGVIFGYKLRLGESSLTPQLYLEAGHDFLSGDDGSVYYISEPEITYYLGDSNPENGYLTIGSQINLESDNGFAINLSYRLNSNLNTITNNTISGGMLMRF